MGEWSDREGWGCRTKTGREVGGRRSESGETLRKTGFYGNKNWSSFHVGHKQRLGFRYRHNSRHVTMWLMQSRLKKERTRDDQSKKRVMSLSMSTKLPILPFPLMLVVTMSLYFPFAAPDRHLKKREECGNNHEYEDQASTQQPISCGR